MDNRYYLTVPQIEEVAKKGSCNKEVSRGLAMDVLALMDSNKRLRESIKELGKQFSKMKNEQATKD